MSALSSAELRRRADQSSSYLAGYRPIILAADEARALADTLDQDQEALKVAEEALRSIELASRPYDSTAGNIRGIQLQDIGCTADKALAAIRARRKG